MSNRWKQYLEIGIMLFLVYLAIHFWEPFLQLLKVILKIIIPLLLGCVMAYVLNILMSFYEKYYFPKSNKAIVLKSKRIGCLIASYLTLFLVLIFVMRLVVPELLSCLQLLLMEVPKVLESIFDSFMQSNIISDSILTSLQTIDWQVAISKIINILKSGIGSSFNFAVVAVTQVAGIVFNVVIAFVFSIYLLTGKEKLSRQVNRVLKVYCRPDWTEKFHYVLSIANQCFHSYIVGQCTEAIILGTLCTIGMFLFGFPYALMTGVLIGVTALIPMAGAYIGGAVGFLLILSVSPTKALLFIVYLVLLQQFEDNLIYPRIVGSSIGLPGIWVLVTITVSGGLFGIVGMMVGVPLAATVYQLIKNDMNRKECLNN